MKKHVILLSSAAAAPTLELIESLSSSGIAVRIEGLHNSEVHGEQFSTAPDLLLANPSAILYEIAPDTAVEELRAAIGFANAKWPGVPIVASRRSSEKTGALNSTTRDPELKRLGFRTALFAGDRLSLTASNDQLSEKGSRPDVLLTELRQLADVVR